MRKVMVWKSGMTLITARHGHSGDECGLLVGQVTAVLNRYECGKRWKKKKRKKKTYPKVSAKPNGNDDGGNGDLNRYHGSSEIV
jgi:hypothetical protein